MCMRGCNEQTRTRVHARRKGAAAHDGVVIVQRLDRYKLKSRRGDVALAAWGVGEGAAARLTGCKQSEGQ